ncbi:MAG: hypothetical protein WBB32_16180 [Flavobacteriales bacterium]|nr:hypothetical protein [Flavobacteriales bacterium]
MRERIGQWSHLIPEGAGDIVVLLVQLFIALTLIGWAYNRGFRATERGPIVRLPLLTLAFGLALLVRHIHSELWQPIMIAAAVIIAGLFSRSSNGRGMGVPLMLIASLLGLGFVLSALALTVVAVLVYMLSPVSKR